MPYDDDFQHDVDQLTANLNDDNLIEFAWHDHDDRGGLSLDHNHDGTGHYHYGLDTSIIFYNPAVRHVVRPDDHGGADATPDSRDAPPDRR